MKAASSLASKINFRRLLSVLQHFPAHFHKRLCHLIQITWPGKPVIHLGVNVDGIKCIPTRVRVRNIDEVNDTCIVEITIVEGRNHIIKRVFETLGYLVDKLTRTKYGFLSLDNLKSGEYRMLSIKEVKKLYEYKN